MQSKFRSSALLALVCLLILPARLRADEGRGPSGKNPPPPERVVLDEDEIRRADRRALGALEVLVGVLMVPVGLGVTVGNALPQCEEEEEDSMGIMSGGVGPCSEDGPSKTGKAAGAGMMIGGIILIADGANRF